MNSLTSKIKWLERRNIVRELLLIILFIGILAETQGSQQREKIELNRAHQSLKAYQGFGKFPSHINLCLAK